MENEKIEEKKLITYPGVFLGASWVEGISSKTNKPYAFGSVRIDFKGLTRDGVVYTRNAEFMVDKKENLPSADIEEYSKVLVEFALPDTPLGKLQFVRIVKGL